jgi:hypothetical protein
MTKKRHAKPGRWTGEEVEHAQPDQAERAAERAEGNVPVPSAAPGRPEAIEAQPTDGRQRLPSGELPDEKIAEAAEEHREAEQDHERRPPHGKL